LLFFKQRNSYTRHEVLKGVTLEIEKGEVIGLVGHNGCGKSTLLKLMTKIIYPDKGKIEINGKISSLLELGAGFHPDMTGRENIYTNASIFGLTKKEIDARLDNIIEFSELEEFIDSPVRTYSSGMYMRLAFSVAINVDADILLIDEILAVGDARFQAKCFNKMLELKKSGITIVIVSHDLGSIERLCNRAIWIENGKIRDEGIPHDIVAEYLDDIMNKDKNEKYEDIIPDAEMVAKMRDYKDAGATIVLNTSRNMRTYQGQIGLINANTAKVLLNWLDKWDIPYDEIIYGKPWPGHRGFYVDDRSVRPDEFLKYSEEELLAICKQSSREAHK